ncbi:MAG: GNAT family N-acetyltransferase [Oligoflexales bacterium]
MLDFETDRLLVMQLPPERANEVAAFHLANREHLKERSPQRPEEFYTEEYWRRRLDQYIEDAANDRSYSFFVAPKTSDEIIGCVSYTNVVRGPFQACNLGYLVSRVHEGKGYTTEAVRRTITFMFEEKNFHRISAGYMPDNFASGRVLEKLGFQKEGVAKEYLLLNGRWTDHILASLVNPHWKA